MTHCSITDCDKPIRVKVRGWCEKHYTCWRRYSDPEADVLTRRPNGLDLHQVFAEYADSNANGCHLWRGGLTNTGYGVFSCLHHTYLAHRVAYELFVGPIPAGMKIDHECRVSRCVNPEHLRLATRKQNNENRKVRWDSWTGVRGVHRVTSTGRYRARVKHHREVVFDKIFGTLEEAEAAAIDARNQVFTHNVMDRAGVLD